MYKKVLLLVSCIRYLLHKLNHHKLRVDLQQHLVLNNVDMDFHEDRVDIDIVVDGKLRYKVHLYRMFQRMDLYKFDQYKLYRMNNHCQ